MTASIDEGYVKYQSHWIEGDAPDASLVDELERWRAPLFEVGLIGHDETHDVGYGNLSVRADGNQFVISGTQTGHIAATGPEHYCLVTAVDTDANQVTCVGPIQASSESLTHAALYALDPSIRAVVHIHSRQLWERCRDELPTTRPEVSYGTPEMAHEFERLWRETDFATRGLAVMAGHADGLVSIGESLELAAEAMLALYRS